MDDLVTRMFSDVLVRPDLMSFGAGFMNPAGFDLAGVRAAFTAAPADDAAPGSVFFKDVEDSVSLRLSFSNHTPQTIAEGMSRLAAALAEVPALVR
jgi:hypothetical protein